MPKRGYDVDGENHFVMLTLPEDRPQPVTQIHIVQNWFTELNEKVPVE